MTGPGEPASKKRPKRCRKLVRPDLQIRITLMTLSVCTVVLAVGFQLNLLDLSALHNAPPRTVAGALGQVKSLLLENLILCFLAVVALSVWTGFIYSFKFCGPLYRFQRFFEDGVEGRWDRPCNLRRGDDLQDMKDAINAFQAVLVDRIHRQDRLLRRSLPLIERAGDEPADPGEIRALIEEITRESAETERRLGPPEPAVEEEKSPEATVA